MAATSVALAKRIGRFQTGFLYHYAFVMLIGVVLLIGWFLFSPFLAGSLNG
jgi:NADH-quinone oxidoreductase subunit L